VDRKAIVKRLYDQDTWVNLTPEQRQSVADVLADDIVEPQPEQLQKLPLGSVVVAGDKVHHKQHRAKGALWYDFDSRLLRTSSQVVRLGGTIRILHIPESEPQPKPESPRNVTIVSGIHEGPWPTQDPSRRDPFVTPPMIGYYRNRY
jgi:hypothetical protein